MQEKRELAQRLFRAGVAAAGPERAVARALSRRPLSPPPAGGAIHVIAVGKAARGMARAALEHLPGPSRPGRGRVLVVTNPENARPLAGAEVLAAGHPVPDEAGLRAARAVMALLAAAGADERILALISGGGSAMLPAPAAGLTLADKAAAGRLLLASGADIHQMNLLRQQLSRLKGGGFLRLAAPAPVRALLLSDVVGDDPRVIASGLTAPPLGDRAGARALARRLGIWAALPDAVRRHLAAPEPAATPGPAPVSDPTSVSDPTPDPAPEPPASGAAPLPLPEAENEIIGSNALSLAAMGREAGGGARIHPAPLVGDVADAARRILDFAAGPGIWLFGGETTVRLGGGGEAGCTGKGGRNQELALRVALLAEARGLGDYVFLSGGSDGRDGPTDAAGGLVDAQSLARMRAAGADPAALLANHDSYHALAASGDLLRTGPTGTNVADLQVLIRW